MGSCVSFSRSPPASTAPAELGRVAAKVVDLDGSMTKFQGPVTAREVLLASGGRHRASSSPCSLCSSDELRFDAPASALAAEEPLQPGQLYFLLPASVLRRPLSGQDMAALAVKAARALAVEAGLAATAGGGVSSPSRRKGGGDGEAGKLMRKTARVAPLVVDLNSSKESRSPEDSSWKHHGYEYDEERTVGKTRHGVRGARRRADVQRLSAVAECSD